MDASNSLVIETRNLGKTYKNSQVKLTVNLPIHSISLLVISPAQV